MTPKPTELPSLEDGLGHLLLLPGHDEGLSGEHLGLPGIAILRVDHHGARAPLPAKGKSMCVFACVFSSSAANFVSAKILRPRARLILSGMGCSLTGPSIYSGRLIQVRGKDGLPNATIVQASHRGRSQPMPNRFDKLWLTSSVVFGLLCPTYSPNLDVL